MIESLPLIGRVIALGFFFLAVWLIGKIETQQNEIGKLKSELRGKEMERWDD